MSLPNSLRAHSTMRCSMTSLVAGQRGRRQKEQLEKSASEVHQRSRSETRNRDDRLTTITRHDAVAERRARHSSRMPVQQPLSLGPRLQLPKSQKTVAGWTDDLSVTSSGVLPTPAEHPLFALRLSMSEHPL